MKAIAQNQKTATSTTAKPQAAVPVQTPEVERPDIATQLAGAALFGHHLSAVNVQSQSPLIVQPKLTVGPTNDKYEQEADRVAQQVVATPAPVQRQDELDEDEELQMKPLVQRQDELDDEDDLQMKPHIQRRDGLDEDEELQMKLLIQRVSAGGFVTDRDFESRPNNTGLPDTLKTGVEKLSGYSLDDVKVRYNSTKPAQLNALAYAQGREIHVAPGQEQHLPHEAWHVVQQRQGRVKATMQMKGGVLVNDDVELEHEADVMGARALAVEGRGHHARPDPTPVMQRRFAPVQHTGSAVPIQMATARTFPDYNPGAVPAFIPTIYTSENFDTNHVVDGPTKEKAKKKFDERKVLRSTILAPGPLTTAMEAKKRDLFNSAATDEKVELPIDVDWNNAIMADEHIEVKVDRIEVNTRLKDGKYEVYHLDESSMNLDLGDLNDWPPPK